MITLPISKLIAIFSILFPIFALIQACGNYFAYAQDGSEILVKVDQFRVPAKSFVVDAKLSDTDNEAEVVVHVNNFSKGLVKFTSPKKSVGRAILYLEEKMWIYVPGARRPLRVSPNQRLLGSVSHADISRTAFSVDYEIKNSTNDGNTIKLELVAKENRKTPYVRINLFVDSVDHKPLSSEFYSIGGDRLLKTMYFEGYEEVLGKPRPMKSRIIDHTNGGHETVIRYSNMRIEESPDVWFQPTYLRRL